MKKLVAPIILFLLSGVSFALTIFKPELFEDWYPQCVRSVSNLLSKISGIVPFALSELFIYMLVIAIPVYIIVSVKRCVKFIHVASILLTWAGALLLSFMWLCGLVYFHSSPSERMGLSKHEPNAQELYETAVFYRDILNSADVKRGDDGKTLRQPLKSYNQAVINGYSRLAGTYDFIIADPAPSKELVFGIVQSYLGISGIYLPWLAESCVNTDTPPQNLPATIAHELAHRQGAAPEDEANFLGILACLNSNDPNTEYSGAFLAFTYLSNALSTADSAKQSELWNGLKAEIIADLFGVREHYEQYEGPVNDMGEALNDTYLKVMQQEEGTKSYGKVVDLLIAEYKTKK